jgi:uncharacterized protein YabN with tetrapyrrole methylase and pyrophosphatase domain
LPYDQYAHPHVFGEEEASTPEDAIEMFNKMKK